jgi:cell division septal protein FtsQ
MRPQRQVRRSGSRPIYGRRTGPAPRRRQSRPAFQLKLPNIRASWVKLAAAGVVVLAVLTLMAQVTRLNEITVSGAKQLDPTHLKQIAEEGSRKQWFGRNTLLVSTGSLESYIETAEPGVKQATIKHRGFHKLSVAVTERQPSLNWKSSNTIYLLDADGTVIGPSKGSYVQLPTVTDTTNLPVKVGDRVAPAAFVSFCAEIIRRLPESGLNVTETLVPETTSEVNIKTDKGYVLKLDTTRTAASELADLKEVLDELAKAKKAPTQYIDLRIEHKAYYK